VAVDDEKFSNGIEEGKGILLFLLFREENNNILLEAEDVRFVFASLSRTIATVLKGEDTMTGISSSSFCNFKV